MSLVSALLSSPIPTSLFLFSSLLCSNLISSFLISLFILPQFILPLPPYFLHSFSIIPYNQKLFLQQSSKISIIFSVAFLFSNLKFLLPFLSFLNASLCVHPPPYHLHTYRDRLANLQHWSSSGSSVARFQFSRQIFLYVY